MKHKESERFIFCKVPLRRSFSVRLAGHFLLAVFFAAFVFSLTGCGNTSVGTETAPGSSAHASPGDSADSNDSDLSTIRLGGLKGPTSMGMVSLLDQCGDFILSGTPDELTTRLLKGELDIASLPINLATVLYNKTGGGVRMIAINTLGVNYIVENPAEDAAPAIGSMAGLKGLTLYATGKGSTPEYILTYLLRKNGLEIGTDVTVVWKSEPAEVVAVMASKPGSVAMLPQPYVAAAEEEVENLRVALDLNAEWDAHSSDCSNSSDSRLVTSVLVARSAFADASPELVDRFLAAYRNSADYVNTNRVEAAQLMENYHIVKASVAEKAILQCNIVCIAGPEMKASAEKYLEIIFSMDPKAVGGCLPGADFYYGRQ